MSDIISTQDLNTTVNHEPRIHDLLIAEKLGFNNMLAIRKLIIRNNEELLNYGEVFSTASKTAPKGGRPGNEYYLNEGQALVICALSRTPKAAEVRKAIIDVFMAYRRGQTPSPTNIITDEQAAMIKDAIWERKHAGKNPIWRYWNIFKNQFHLTEYKNLPADRFEEAMEFIQNMPESRIRQNSQQHIDFMVKCAINTLQKYRSDILDVDSNNNTQTIECGRNFQNVIRDLFESNNKAKLELKKILQQIEKYVHYMDAVNKNSERGDELYHDLIIATTKKLDEAYAFAGPQSGKLIFINDLDNAELQKHGGNL